MSTNNHPPVLVTRHNGCGYIAAGCTVHAVPLEIADALIARDAAVAELIEAANVAGRAMESMTTLLEHYRDESLFHKRLDAWFREYAFTADQVASALARVGGA